MYVSTFKDSNPILSVGGTVGHEKVIMYVLVFFNTPSLLTLMRLISVTDCDFKLSLMSSREEQ